jgi:hypothetical protein
LLEVEPPTTTVVWIIELDLVMMMGIEVVAFPGGAVVVALEEDVGPEDAVVVELPGTVIKGG